MTSTVEYCLMQQLRYCTSAAAADGLARDPASYAQLLVRHLRCGGSALEPLADFVTVLRSPDADVVAAAAVAAGVIEALERLMRGEVELKEEGTMIPIVGYYDSRGEKLRNLLSTVVSLSVQVRVLKVSKEFLRYLSWRHSNCIFMFCLSMVFECLWLSNVPAYRKNAIADEQGKSKKLYRMEKFQ